MNPGLSYRVRIILLLLLLPALVLSDQSLPEPLTFDAAVSSAGNPSHFELEAIEQQLLALRAELGIETANQGFSLDLRGRLREVGLSDIGEVTDADTDDSAASLILSRPLYTFGLQGSRENRLALQLQALELQKQLVIEQRRLKIQESYFSVLNADNQFISENEALAIGFIRFDNAREDQEMGLVSQIDVLERQSRYESIRQQRYRAQQQQRLTRAILAEAMGYPDQLSSELEIPEIDLNRGLPDDFESLIERALEHSLEARLAKANTLAAQAEIAVADATDNASLDLELEVSHYERESRLRDDWRASLYFDIPIYSGSSAARVSLARARHRQALAMERQMQSHLRLEALELWQRIQQLRLEIEGKSVEQEYREVYLDRSRAEYELEFKTDLGDSMVLYSRSNTERLRTIYAYELAYQRLAALVGADFLNQFAKSQ